MHHSINAAWRKVSQAETMKRDDLCVLRDAKLRRVLAHAAMTVPFYKKLFVRKGIATDDVTIADFPVLDKKDIRGHENDFVSEGWSKKLNWTRTSGSTGEPFRFARSEYDYAYATLWKGLDRWGIRPGDKRVFVKGVDIRRNVSFTTRIWRRIYEMLNRCIVVDAHFLAMSDDNVEHELHRIIRYRPQYIHGYASSIYVLARYVEKYGMDCSRMRLKAIVTESEKCYAFQRQVIERVFKAPVVENYGSVEFGMIAQPARDGRLCINEDHVYAETTPDGEVVLTNLDEYGFPLIRFKNGDKVIIGEVHDELPYRTLSSIEGRVAETIRLPNGGALQGYIVMYPISKHMRYLREYQVYQPDINHLFIRIVEIEPLPKEIERQIICEMRSITGDDIDIEIQKVPSIPLTKRGKRTFVCSDVRV